MSKKLLILCLALVVLVSCSKNNKGNQEDEKDCYVFGGSTSTGSFYIQSAAVANIWENSKYVDTFSIEATTGSFENLLLVSEGEADFGLASSLAVSCANQGKEPFSKKQENLTGVCYGAPTVYHFIVKEESDIHSIQDIKGHTISTGTVGSGGEQEAREILAALGITYEDFKRVDYIGVGDGLSALKDGKVDVAICGAGVPNASILEACLGDNLRILELSEEEIETVFEKCDWVGRSTITAGTYNGVDKDINTVCSLTILLANKNISSDVMYDFTKRLYENYDSLCQSNSIFNSWSFSKDMGELIEVNSGSLKFFNEVL